MCLCHTSDTCLPSLHLGLCPGRAGVGKQVAEITEDAMQGKIDFKESFRRRMMLLKGMDEAVLEGIAATLPITEGAPRLISNLKRLGYKVCEREREGEVY